MLHPSIVANQLYEKNIIDTNTKAKLVSPDPSKDADFLLRAIEAYFCSVFDDKDREKEFLDVLDVLHSHIPLNKVVDKMKEEYHGKTKISEFMRTFRVWKDYMMCKNTLHIQVME